MTMFKVNKSTRTWEACRTRKALSEWNTHSVLATQGDAREIEHIRYARNVRYIGDVKHKAHIRYLAACKTWEQVAQEGIWWRYAEHKSIWDTQFSKLFYLTYNRGNENITFVCSFKSDFHKIFSWHWNIYFVQFLMQVSSNCNQIILR